MNSNFYELVDERTRAPVRLPDRRVDFRGEHNFTVYGGTPPKKLGSTGRVRVKDEDAREAEFYPSVFGLAWQLRPQLHTAAQLMQTGGGFLAGIGRAYQAADASNAWRLLQAFEDEFTHYLGEVDRAAAGR